MPHGGVHRERVGVCPHCRNPRIRTRRRQHRRMNWRCRNCNRVFASPGVGVVVVEEWPGVDLVYLDRTSRTQTGGSRPAGQGGRGNFGCGCLFFILIIVGVASFFAISRNADFPGAETIRTAGEEVSQRLGGNGVGVEEPPPISALTPMPESAATATATLERSVAPSLTPALGRAIESTSTPLAMSDPSRAAIAGPQPTHTPQETPAATPTSRPAPVADSTPTLAATLAPQSILSPTVKSPEAAATPTSTPTVTPTPRPTPTVTPTPTPPPPPDRRHYEHKAYILELINHERAKAGAPLVTLGDNIAAQLHAEASLKNCTASHWGVDGLKPYMRYSLAGGYQANGENWLGSDYCIKASDGYRTLGSIESEIREAMDFWMDSPGHRRNILDKWHKKVNIGLAWDKYNFMAAQHFEGGYVEYSQLPEIANGALSFSGRAIDGLRFSGRTDLGMQLFYDPPPHPLTQGQVSRTYCYSSGLQIAAFRYPLTVRYKWSENEFTTTHSSCPDPYDVPPDAPAPRSPDEAHRFWEQAYAASQAKGERTITVPWITASKWTARGTEFSVSAEISGLLSEYGPGVYTVRLWGQLDGEDVLISEYSIFYGVEPPDTYNPGQSK